MVSEERKVLQSHQNETRALKGSQCPFSEEIEVLSHCEKVKIKEKKNTKNMEKTRVLETDVFVSVFVFPGRSLIKRRTIMRKFLLSAVRNKQ